MNTAKNLWFLEKQDISNALFNEINPEHSDCVHRKKISKGTSVYNPDEKPDRIFVLENGQVKTGTYSSKGKEIIKSIVSPGEIFGELALFQEVNRGEFAVALQDSEVLMINTDDVRRIAERDSKFCFRLTILLGKRLMKTERRLDSLLFKDARTRIVEYLKEQARENGIPVGYETLIKEFNFTHQEIANLTGTSRQTVTTVLNELKDADLIYLNRRSLLIRNMSALK